jgi:hypothetical protein
MKRRTKRVLGSLAFAAGSLGALGAVVIKRNLRSRRRAARESTGNSWARPGMNVTFRAELMPGRDASERTFRVKELLPSGRVLLHEVAGEHAEKEFEPIH